MNIDGKTVVLTGATGGIGEAFAHALAQAGACLILVSRSEHKLAALLPTLPGEGHRAVQADIATDPGRQLLLSECDAGVDVLINNAGVNHFGLLENQSQRELREMLELNTLAPMLLCQAILPLLRQRESAIVNVGSGFGSIGFAGYCGYSASKFALRGFSEALRRELADSSVAVLYLAPRATATDMNPAAVVAMNEELGNAVDQPETVADALMHLLNKNERARYLGWPERFFVKLNALLPSVVDKALAKQLPVIRKRALAAPAQAG